MLTRSAWKRLAASFMLVASLSMPALSDPIPRHPSAATIGAVADRFKATMKDGGITGTSKAIQDCYMNNVSNSKGIADCMLWDVAAMRLDAAMRKLFIAQGMKDPGSGTPFLTPKAFEARLETYGRLAFGTDKTAIGRYLGNAPDQVVNQLPD